MPAPAGPIVVTGATGTTGGAVVTALLERGAQVRAVTRSPRRARKLEQSAGIEAVVADLDDPTALPHVLDGASAAYLVNPASPGLPAREGAFAEAAAAAGLRLVVKLSVIGAEPDATIDFDRVHGAAEGAIRRGGVPAAMLRANGFMQNTLAWAAQIPSGTVRMPVPDARWSIIDARDIAAVAATALVEPDPHAGATYTLTGPEPLSSREELAIVAELLDRDLSVQESPVPDTVEHLKGIVGEWTAERLGELWEMYATGAAEGVSDDVERVTGRPPCDFRTFAADHRAAFAGS